MPLTRMKQDERTHHVDDDHVDEALHCKVRLPAARGAAEGERLQADGATSSHMASVHHTPEVQRDVGRHRAQITIWSAVWSSTCKQALHRPAHSFARSKQAVRPTCQLVPATQLGNLGLQPGSHPVVLMAFLQMRYCRFLLAGPTLETPGAQRRACGGSQLGTQSSSAGGPDRTCRHTRQCGQLR